MSQIHGPSSIHFGSQDSDDKADISDGEDSEDSDFERDIDNRSADSAMERYSKRSKMRQ